MKTRTTALSAAFGLGTLLLAPSAGATIGSLDQVPAATLLYPYFEVDVGAGTSDTLISVQNSGATAILANVTIWSEAGVPVQHFPVYLTGYDVQSISLRDILVNGALPRTASAGQDPNDAISPKGNTSQDINFATCNGVLPLPNITGADLTGLQAALTGKASSLLGNRCAGADHGDTLARGYVTVDTVNNCTARSPADPGYFGSGGTGDATNQNVLLGDFFLVDGANGHAQAQTAVHLEASATNAATSTNGNYTFYGRLVGWSAADNREPLATEWTIPFTTNETDVVMWRDSKTKQEPFACGTALPPLGNEGVAAFDMQENLVDLSNLNPFSTTLTRARIGSSTIPVTSKNGALVFSSNGVAGGAPGPAIDPAAAQSFAFAIHYPGASNDAQTRFGTSVAATPADNATKPIHGFPFNDRPLQFGGLAPTVGVANVNPAATLLAPYFEVDTVDPSGVNTQIRIVNQYASAILVHATLWTDYGIPTQRVNIYLTGYDASVIDLRWLFQKGIVDLTASAGQDPGNTISPKGPFSQDINFASCGGQLPPARLPADAVADLISTHTGKASPQRFAGKCAGASHGDAIARGYVTFDLVTNCTQRAPSDPGYFGPNFSGDATNQNNLSGTYTIIDRNQKLSVADTLVHVEASATESRTSTPGNPTFYGKFVNWNASDNREPLGTAWQTRFIADAAAGSVFGAFADGKTNLTAWRESTTIATPFTCGQVPAGFPLPIAGVLQYDEQEQVTALGPQLNPFPLVTQRVPITDPTLAAVYASGFYTFDLRAPQGAVGGPTSDPARRGGFVTATHHARAAGYQVLLGGFQLP